MNGMKKQLTAAPAQAGEARWEKLLTHRNWLNIWKRGRMAGWMAKVSTRQHTQIENVFFPLFANNLQVLKDRRKSGKFHFSSLLFLFLESVAASSLTYCPKTLNESSLSLSQMICDELRWGFFLLFLSGRQCWCFDLARRRRTSYLYIPITFLPLILRSKSSHSSRALGLGNVNRKPPESRVRLWSCTCRRRGQKTTKTT